MLYLIGKENCVQKIYLIGRPVWEEKYECRKVIKGAFINYEDYSILHWLFLVYKTVYYKAEVNFRITAYQVCYSIGFV